MPIAQHIAQSHIPHCTARLQDHVKTYLLDLCIDLQLICNGPAMDRHACAINKRRYIGIELEKKYIELAKKRINEIEKENEGGGDFEFEVSDKYAKYTKAVEFVDSYRDYYKKVLKKKNKFLLMKRTK